MKRPNWPRLRPWAQAALMAAAACCVTFPAWRGGWLWDDREEIILNPALRDAAGLVRIWSRPPGNDYYPLKTTVQWVQWHLWRDHALGYHLTNVGLHLISGLLIWKLLRKIGIDQAWLGGLLFIVHPICVESVAWMAELKNTLSLPPLLLAACAYLDHDAKRMKPSYGVALLWFLFSMLCKTSGAMFPAVILLYAWWRRGRVGRSDLISTAPFFIVSLAMGSVTLWFQQHRSIAAESFLPPGMVWRTACSGLAAAFYFCKSVFPLKLLPIYPRWEVDPSRLVEFAPWLAASGVGAWLWSRRTGWGRHALFGLGFFLINLAPVVGFVPISHMRFAWTMDHLAYLPLVGLVGLTAAGLGLSRRPVILGALAGTGIFLLAIESNRYSQNYLNEKALWEFTLRRNPGAWLADNNLGSILLAEGRTGDAIRHFRAAMRTKPGYAEASNNLGDALRRTGDLSEAIACYRLAVELRPEAAEFHNNLGLALDASGQRSEAIRQLEEAVRLKPEFGEANNNLGVFLAGTGHLREAVDRYEQALRVDPENAEAHSNLGAALVGSGRIAEGVAEYEAALRLNPNLINAHYNLGLALRALHRPSEAEAQMREAARLRNSPLPPDAGR